MSYVPIIICNHIKRCVQGQARWDSFWFSDSFRINRLKLIAISERKIKRRGVNEKTIIFCEFSEYLGLEASLSGELIIGNKYFTDL